MVAYTAPRPATDGLPRTCDFGTSGSNPGPAFTCNNKLIGAYTFMSSYRTNFPTPAAGEYTDARDDEGHGTHTSTTAAGDGGVAASTFGVPGRIVSGIAPRAHVIMYKICGQQGCFSSDAVAAIQRAIVDDVDVLNYSISGGTSPYTDVVSLAFLDAYNAGIFVAASAGNSGPTANTVEHAEPWVTTVGATTGPRAFTGTAVLTAGANRSHHHRCHGHGRARVIHRGRQRRRPGRCQRPLLLERCHRHGFRRQGGHLQARLECPRREGQERPEPTAASG